MPSQSQPLRLCIKQSCEVGFYNVKAYVLHRDGYKCKSGQKGNHSKKLHVHHIQFKSNGGTDIPSNLITLCETCHDALHRGEFELKTRKTKTKPATEMGIIKSQLIKSDWDFAETFGYETKSRFYTKNILPKVTISKQQVKDQKKQYQQANFLA
ncbi:MAG: HNH endonuclease [Pseudomonadota bacterium]